MPEGEQILIVGEAFGEQEAYLAHPFVGASGRELISLLMEAGILPLGKRPYEPTQVRDYWLNQSLIRLTNVFNLRPEKNDVLSLCTSASGDKVNRPPLRAGKYVRAEYNGELERLTEELASTTANLVIALGSTATWALLGSGGISGIRGAITQHIRTPSRGTQLYTDLPSEERQDIREVQPTAGGRSSLAHGQPGGNTVPDALKVLPTYHPAAILRDWSLRAITLMDLKKANIERQFPEVRRPRRTLYLEPTLEDLEWFWSKHLQCAERIAVDIETQGRLITCIGFAPSPQVSIVVPFRDMRKKGWSYWPTSASEVLAWKWVRRVCQSGIPLIFQNGLYDIHYLWREAGIPTPVDEDTMLLHHALYPELQKGLGFLGSIYTNEASWKLMNRSGATFKKDE